MKPYVFKANTPCRFRFYGGIWDPGPKTPLYVSAVAAGFPSPAEDYIEARLDLNELLVQHPVATFFVRVEGDSMLGAGIHPGDLLVVDRAVEASDGSVVVAVLDGEFTVKRIRKAVDGLYLLPENGAYPALKIDPAREFQVWGVVTHVIHAV